MFVIRRKTPNARGNRYLAAPNPVAHSLSDARLFDTAEVAHEERRRRREPHLWEVLDEQEAARRDAEEASAFARKMQATPAERRGLGMFRVLAMLAPGMVIPPR